VFDFGALPPEINSGRMYAGPGAESIMVAATAWDELAAELGTAASGYSSVISELTSAPWVGPSSAAMVSAVVPYVSWLGTTAGLAEESASQARAAAAAFESAFAMTVPPPVIVANRVLLATLVATNFFGQNTPAIMATEAQYMEMWAQDAAAMYGYAAASAVAAVLTEYQPPPNTTTPEGVLNQGLMVAQAAAQPAGNSGQIAAQFAQAASIPQTLQQLALQALSVYTFKNWPFSMLQSQLEDFVKFGFWTPTNNWIGIPATPSTGINSLYNAGRQWLQAYFGVGIGNFGFSIGQQTTFGAGGATAGAGGAWYPTPQFAGLHLGAVGGGIGGVHPAGAVSAGAGQAGKIGMLSVPANWSTPTSQAAVTLAAAEETPAPAQAGANVAPGNALLRGVPPGAVGRRTAGYGYTNKYGFRYSVLTRPPSAG
jgi:PPE-repeat protein